MTSLLFITRTWEGLGGLQRFSRELWDGWRDRYGENARLVALKQKGVLQRAVFTVRAVQQGIHAAKSGASIHLGDASLSPIAFLIKRFASARISANACGLDLVYPPAWYQFLLRRTMKSIDTFCCNSEATAEVLRAMGWKGTIVVIPCAVSPVSPRTGMPDTRTLVLLGRLVPRKGAAWFIRDVLPLLTTRMPDLKCLIIGEGPEEETIERAVQELHLMEAVVLTGAVTEEEKDAIVRSASVLVVPNVRRAGDMEGFGIVCLEASVRGVPVAAARLEGLQDAVIDGETGRFFRAGDSADCAGVIERMLRESWDPAVIHRATMVRYSRDRILSLYHHVFD